MNKTEIMRVPEKLAKIAKKFQKDFNISTEGDALKYFTLLGYYKAMAIGSLLKDAVSKDKTVDELLNEVAPRVTKFMNLFEFDLEGNPSMADVKKITEPETGGKKKVTEPEVSETKKKEESSFF